LELKRIDHRHHALDALIIAATTREHIRYLNSLNAVDSDAQLKQVQRTLVKGKIRDFKTPWESFTEDARKKLEETIVSFKTNNKIISKPSNTFTKWEKQEDYSYKKVNLKQTPKRKWMAVRKSMFKEPLGIILIKETKNIPIIDAIKIQIERMQVEHDNKKRKTASYIYDKFARQSIKDLIYRSGIDINETEILFKELKNYISKNSKSIETEKINQKGKKQKKTIYMLNGKEYERITIAEFIPYASKRMSLTKKDYVEKLTIEKMKNDFPYFTENQKRNNHLNKLFLSHIKEYKNDPKEAFSAEGIEALNKKALADPKMGKPIHSITRIESKKEDDKFGNSYIEVDKGSNAYFIMYENKITKERTDYKSLATHKAIERLVKKEPLAEEKDGLKSIIISPNDLVYVPTKNEQLKIKSNISIENAIDWEDKKKIFNRTYKMISCTGKECHFIPHFLSKPIIDNNELGSNNKSEKSWDGNVNYEKKVKERKQEMTQVL
jgi:CRISPR-associated endonuclease Csn1